MISVKDYEWATEEFVNEQITKILSQDFSSEKVSDIYSFILNCIDLTTLEGSDNQEKVRRLCEKACSFSQLKKNAPEVAAVCVYPVYARLVRRFLQGTGIKTACVAGAFPAGQSPLKVKLAEVQYAVEEGAEEIDMVISRGTLLEGNYNQVFDEIAAIKKACGKAHLKVILETGELETYQNILIASDLSISAGADFIKTSTGKIPVAATETAAFLMLSSIKKHYEKTGKMVGFKASGGISTPDKAISYVKLTHSILGNKWLTNNYFRIGASRLADAVFEKII